MYGIIVYILVYRYFWSTGKNMAFRNTYPQLFSYSVIQPKIVLHVRAHAFEALKYLHAVQAFSFTLGVAARFTICKTVWSMKNLRLKISA